MSFFHGVYNEDWYRVATPTDEEKLQSDIHPEEDLSELDLPTFTDDFSKETDVQDPDRPIPTVRITEFIESVLRIPNEEGRYAAFSFRGRNHLPTIYNTPAKEILLCTARQVEKCVSLQTRLYTKQGIKRAKDVVPGDLLLSIHEGTNRLEWKPVRWKSLVVRKKAIRVKVEGGRTIVCGEEHPFRVWQGWKKAQDLQPGQLVEGVTALPSVAQGTEESVAQGVVALLRILGTVMPLAVDANPYRNAWHLTISRPKAKDMLLELLGRVGGCRPSVHFRVVNGSPTVVITGPMGRWLHRMRGKGCPVNQLDDAAARAAATLLWASRGHFFLNSTGSLVMELTVSTEEEAEWIRYLMHRVGIETGIHARKVKGTPFVGHHLRVRGRNRNKLLELLPSWMQAELPPRHEASLTRDRERDPLPKEALQALRKDWRSFFDRTRKPYQGLSLFGRRASKEDGMSRKTLESYLEAMERLGFPEETMRPYRNALNDQTRWLRVLEVSPAGEEDMVDFEVEDNHSFVAEGIITHNSTYLGNRLLAYSAFIPGYKSLYVSPSSVQTKTFSGDRLRNPIETSPFLKEFAGSGGVQNVLEMVFANSSKITLRSAYLSADRARGIPAYLLCCDEFQDLLPEHIPVILPCTSHAPKNYRFHLFAGTPKSFDNNIEFYRSGFNAERPMSTMGEWMVPCDSCGSKAGWRFWQCLSEENIQKKGLSCSRCGALLQPQHPDAFWHHQQADGRFESYRIPQLMVPWRDWGEIYADYINFPKAKFYNEVLGLSMDDHSRPLSMSEMRACCDPRIRMDRVQAFAPGTWHEKIFAGIDWGMGTSSYTVMTLGTYVGGIFTIFWAKRFTGQLLDVEEQIHYVLKTLRQFNVELVGTDFGFGLQYNDHLIRNFGRDKVGVYQHLSKVTKKIVYDTKVGRFKVFRSLVMADFINMVKRQNIRFPRWEDFREPFAQDFCNITSEYNETQQITQYTHRGDRPDDSFHSALYCFLASTIRIPRPDIFTPLHNRYRQGPVLTLDVDVNQG